jgi:hypothetical protein
MVNNMVYKYDPICEDCPDVERFIWENVSFDSHGDIVVNELSFGDLVKLYQITNKRLHEMNDNLIYGE